MPAYRLYCFDRDGGIVRARWIAADEDEQAIDYARTKECSHHRCELWEGGRWLADIRRR